MYMYREKSSCSFAHHHLFIPLLSKLQSYYGALLSSKHKKSIVTSRVPALPGQQSQVECQHCQVNSSTCVPVCCTMPCAYRMHYCSYILCNHHNTYTCIATHPPTGTSILSCLLIIKCILKASLASTRTSPHVLHVHLLMRLTPGMGAVVHLCLVCTCTCTCSLLTNIDQEHGSVYRPFMVL